VDIQLIRTDGGTQPRAEISNEVVQDYAQDMLQGAKFPAVVVFYDGAAYWLADGFHRVAAAKVARLAEIDVDVRQGTRRDAILYAVGANGAHGFRRSNDDKRRSVITLLDDAEWSQWSSNKIAEKCAVSHTFVDRIREERRLVNQSLASDASDSATVKYQDRWGNERTMNTGNIGQRARPPQLQSLPFGQEMGDEPLEDDEPSEWDEMARTAQVPTQAQAPKGKPTFNRTNDNIEWAWWSWNPVTGCKHDCPYCYARDIAMRFSGTFEPQFHPERLEAPANTRPPTLPEGAPEVNVIGSTNVFVCSMADLFGEWVPQEWIDAVLDAVRRSPQWNYIFLTKNPERLATIDWPVNAWVGTTVDRQARVARAEAAFAKVNAEVKFVSCEPMLEPIRFASPDLFNWFIIGGQSKSTQCPASQPQWEWVEALFGQARAVNAMVYFKTNLEARPREYPGA